MEIPKNVIPFRMRPNPYRIYRVLFIWSLTANFLLLGLLLAAKR